MLTVDSLRKSYAGMPVLDSVSLGVGDDEIVALVGPSGCGKTTILDIVAGLVRPDAGSVDTGGARVGYVFQEDRLLPWLTVAENVASVGEASRRGEVADLLLLVGLEGFGGFYPAALSGGMRQRCAIARAYHYRSGLLLMDEPFKSLDPGLRRDMLSLLLALRNERRNAVLFVTHDIDEAIAVASRIVVLGPRPARVAAEHRLEPSPALRDPRERGALREEIVAAMGGRRFMGEREI